MTSRSPHFRQSHGANLALWLAGAGALAILWSALCTVSGIYWNPPRLAPAFALAEGLNIYATRASAAHLGWHYGPIFPLFSLPAALASNITVAFWIWSGLNLLAIGGPAWLVLRECLGGRRIAWIGVVLYFVLLLSNEITQSMIFFIHIDALCVALGTLAGWGVYWASLGINAGRFLHGAALWVALAVGTKQVAITLVPALFAWLWWRDRRALAQRLLFRVAAYGGGLAVLAVVLFALGSAFSSVVRRKAGWLPYRGQEELLRTARANPGRMYFPWNPLLTIITDKRIYPFDNALFCLAVAGLEPSPDKIRAAVPKAPVLLYQEPAQSKFALKYFPPRTPAPQSQP